MSRTTRAQLEGTLTRLCDAAGLPRQTEPGTPGVFLDTALGGYIVRRRNADTSESDIFGSRIRSAGELWDVMSFAIQTHPQRP